MGLNVHLNCRPATREEGGGRGRGGEERNNGKYREKGGVDEKKSETVRSVE